MERDVRGTGRLAGNGNSVKEGAGDGNWKVSAGEPEIYLEHGRVMGRCECAML